MKKMMSSLLVLVALACLCAASRTSRALVRNRAERALNASVPHENLPPAIAFTTVALGGFRGVLADLLWFRAARLQEEGAYFEIVQLSDWITTLEPRFTAVWAFHGWNMAYNISVMFDEPEDRWRWVMNGIRLLRDQGIRYNPGDPALYRELGWLFQHKIGGATDEFAMYYRRKWAEEVEAALGGGVFRIDAIDPAQKQSLAERLALDPEIVQQVDETYGPFDWRLPESHAVYWAHRGRQQARGKPTLACDRMVFQATSDAFRHGRLFSDKANDLFILTPNLKLLPKVRRAYEHALAQYGRDAVGAAYANFLREACLILYSYNNVDTARSLFSELKTRFPEHAGPAGFERYVTDALTAELREGAPRDAAARAEACFYQSYFWFALGDRDRARGYERLGELVWRRHRTERPAPAGAYTLRAIKNQARQRALAQFASPVPRKRLESLAP